MIRPMRRFHPRPGPFLIALALSALLAAAACGAPPEPTTRPAGRPTDRLQVGTNLDSITDWTTAWAFTDVFKHSRPWQANARDLTTGKSQYGAGGELELDERGWVKQLKTWTDPKTGRPMRQEAGTIMVGENRGAYPGGRYRAEWRGRGKIEWNFPVARQGFTRDAAGPDGTVVPGVDWVEIDFPAGSDKGIWMTIVETDPADPVRDVRVWMPETGGHTFVKTPWRPGDEWSPFHPLFVERLRGFAVIRFMDWAETNRTPDEEYADRRHVDDARQRALYKDGPSRGVAHEYLVALANEVGADPWLCMPPAADDDYVRRYATYVRDHLDPGREVYLEWGNEAWNTAGPFLTSKYVAEQAKQPENAGKSRERVIAEHARADFAIWSEVFAGQTDRLVRVVGGFLVNDGFARGVTNHMGGEFDAIATVAYFAPSKEGRASWGAGTTGDDVMDDVIGLIDRGGSVPFWRRHKALADEWSQKLGRPIRLVSYEGGPDVNAGGVAGRPFQRALFDANTSPRMVEAYRKQLAAFADAGGDLFMQFGTIARQTQHGSFGALTRQDEPAGEAPKWRAVRMAIDGTLFDPDAMTDRPRQ